MAIAQPVNKAYSCLRTKRTASQHYHSGGPRAGAPQQGAPIGFPGLDRSCLPGLPLVGNVTIVPPMPLPPNPALINYFNDGGNVTTLRHVLNSAGILGNATIADVMDIGGDFSCVLNISRRDLYS